MEASVGPKVAIVVVNYRTPVLAVRCVTALTVERAASLGFGLPTIAVRLL